MKSGHSVLRDTVLSLTGLCYFEQWQTPQVRPLWEKQVIRDMAYPGKMSWKDVLSLSQLPGSLSVLATVK